MPNPELIVMLTRHDYTVENAIEVFEQCKNSNALYWGIKENPLPHDVMKRHFARMKECGKRTILEVVAYTESEGLAGAQLAAECGCDILLGTCYYDAINDFCKEHNIRYMPFVGNISGRPSVLSGDIDDIVKEAKDYADKGVYGLNLLGYRYTGDATALNNTLVKQVDAPVCIAGSVDSYKRLDEIKEARPRFLTIGSAFFDKRFGETPEEQINNVCNYMEK